MGKFNIRFSMNAQSVNDNNAHLLPANAWVVDTFDADNGLDALGRLVDKYGSEQIRKSYIESITPATDEKVSL